MKLFNACLIALVSLIGSLFAVEPAQAQAACVQEVGGVLSASLAWTNPDVIDPVGILRGTTTGGPYTQIATVPAGTLTYVDTTVKAGITYSYVVQNQSVAAGPSANSNEVCKTFFAVPPAPVLTIK